MTPTPSRRAACPLSQRFLTATLAPAERIRLKLASPLGVAKRVIVADLGRVDEAQALLADDLSTVADIDRQLEAYADDVAHELELRLADLDTTLLRLERRGLGFFDDRVRLGRVRGLLDRDRLRVDFEREVVADAPEEIERKVGELIDWLVESDLAQWQAVVQHVTRRRSAHADRVVGDLAGRFSADRTRLLETVGRAASQGLERYDRAAEARQVADDLQRAVAGAALAEVGAVGLGAAVAWLATSTAVDATGFAAAGLLAALGLVILPARRRQAKKELGRKIEGLRAELHGPPAPPVRACRRGQPRPHPRHGRTLHPFRTRRARRPGGAARAPLDVTRPRLCVGRPHRDRAVALRVARRLGARPNTPCRPAEVSTTV